MSEPAPGSESFNPRLFDYPPEAPKVRSKAKDTTPAQPATPTKAVEPATCTCQSKNDDQQPVTDVYRRRRMLAAPVIIAILTAAAFVLFAQPWQTLSAITGTSTSSQDTTSQATVVTSQDSTDVITHDMAYAQEYLATNGTLDGIILNGAQVAVRDQTMYVARNTTGTCIVYGILNGAELEPSTDPTGAACTGQIVTVQAQLDAAAAQVATNSVQSVQVTLDQATRSALTYASRNYVDGAPSLTGLPAQLSGALVVDNTGGTATLRVEYPGACAQAYVTAAGEVGPAQPC